MSGDKERARGSLCIFLRVPSSCKRLATTCSRRVMLFKESKYDSRMSSNFAKCTALRGMYAERKASGPPMEIAVN